MNLLKKKKLASRTLKIGSKRISFVNSRLEEIKEIITKQDIRDLVKEGAIIIKDICGRKKNITKKRKRSVGNIRKKVNKKKQEYVKATRKQRKYVGEMRKQGKITREESIEIRKKIRNRNFKSAANLKEHIGGKEQ